MRVTNKMMTDTVSANLFRQAIRLLDAQEIVSSEKIINRPSDDPIGMGKVLDYRKALSSTGQYQRNVTRGKMWVEHTEVVLDEVNDLLRQAQLPFLLPMMRLIMQRIMAIQARFELLQERIWIWQ